MLRKSFASFMALMLLVSFLVPSASFAAEKSNNMKEPVVSDNYIQDEPSNVDDGEVEAAGKTGWFIKGGMQIAELAVRYGGSGLSKIVKFLDADQARYLSKNSGKIADGIDDAQKKISDLEDYSQKRLSGIIQQSLDNMGVSKTYYVPIGDAIAAGVMLLI